MDILVLLVAVPVVADILASAADRVVGDSPVAGPDNQVVELRIAAEQLLADLEAVEVLQGSLREPDLESHLNIRLVGELRKALLVAEATRVGIVVAVQAAVGEIPAAAVVSLAAAMAGFPAAAEVAIRVACKLEEWLQEVAGVDPVVSSVLHTDLGQAGMWESDRKRVAVREVAVVRVEAAEK